VICLLETYSFVLLFLQAFVTIRKNIAFLFPLIPWQIKMNKFWVHSTALFFIQISQYRSVAGWHNLARSVTSRSGVAPADRNHIQTFAAAAVMGVARV
jgi:hypothetical protein